MVLWFCSAVVHLSDVSDVFIAYTLALYAAILILGSVFILLIIFQFMLPFCSIDNPGRNS